MKSISIIGMGWLGLPLAKSLQNKGYQISATKSAIEDKHQFDSLGFPVYQLNLQNLDDSESLGEVLSSDCIIITVPPSAEFFIEGMKSILKQLDLRNPKARVLYTSSISVYGNQFGFLNELSETQPETDNGRKLVELEGILSSRDQVSCCIRLGGLVGPNRHPVHYLSGKTDIKNPKASVNLVHQTDIIRLMHALLQSKRWPKCINFCSPEHPTKEKYYTEVANELKLSLPKFVESKQTVSKIITSVELTNIDFKFTYTSPFEYPEANTN